MAFLIVSTESVEKEGSGDYIQTSGIYDLNLKHVEIVETKNGAYQANYFFNKVMSYGNNVISTQGEPTFGYKILESLAAIIGEEALSDPEPTTVTFKAGDKELNCIPELNDIDIKAWIQFKYRVWNGEIREDVIVKRFYRASDGANGKEVLSGEDIGTRLSKDIAVASENVYEDGTTPESVAAWKAAKAKGESAKGTVASTSAAPKKAGFPSKAGFPGKK